METTGPATTEPHGASARFARRFSVFERLNVNCKNREIKGCRAPGHDRMGTWTSHSRTASPVSALL